MAATPPKKSDKDNPTTSSMWSAVDDSNLYPTPTDLKSARMYPRLRPLEKDSSTEDSTGVIMSLEDLYWIKDHLHNLRKSKAEETALTSAVHLFEEKITMINSRLDGATHCLRNVEFEDLKGAINSWRIFFRNMVVTGTVGALFVIAGWLWQYYSLVSQVKKTSENIAQVSQTVSVLQSDYAQYKQDRFAEGVKTESVNDARFVRLEYKLISAMSKLSQGKKVPEPNEPASKASITSGVTHDE